MFVVPAMATLFEDAAGKTSRDADGDETEEQGNPQFSHRYLQAMLL
jgi:hypothetical protein